MAEGFFNSLTSQFCAKIEGQPWWDRFWNQRLGSWVPDLQLPKDFTSWSFLGFISKEDGSVSSQNENPDCTHHLYPRPSPQHCGRTSQSGEGGWRGIGFGPLVDLAAVMHPAFRTISPSLLDISSSRDMV